jgi:beta-lactamase superfamily II metal-dependent hydrolase
MRILLFFLLSMAGLGALAQPTLPPWQPGMMDIHHISTGRGNSTFLIFPDRTTLLIDAGEISDTHARTRSPRNSAIRPDSSRTASEWIVDYVRQFYPGATPRLDYALITHFHDDHFGEWDPTRPLAANGAYRLTGIMRVGDALPVGQLIDRGGHFPLDIRSEAFRSRFQGDDYHVVQTLDAYFRFIDWQKSHTSMRHDSLRPGASDQIRLLYQPQAYPTWQVRNLAANGRVWTGYAEGDYQSLYAAGQYPGENPLSTCIKISFGPFDYFTGGDISGMGEFGEADFQSMEAHVGPVSGAVDVATLNHHANRDSESPYFVRSIRPRVWVQQVWSSDHPGEEVLRRITSPKMYPGTRDLFTTDMLPANELVIGERIARSYKNLHGHVVVRVMDEGRSYKVYVLNDFSDRREVLAEFGPYLSR